MITQLKCITIVEAVKKFQNLNWTIWQLHSKDAYREWVSPYEAEKYLNERGYKTCVTGEILSSLSSIVDVKSSLTPDELITQMIIGNIPEDLKYDVDKDGKITSMDAMLIKQIGVGSRTELPIIKKPEVLTKVLKTKEGSIIMVVIVVIILAIIFMR